MAVSKKKTNKFSTQLAAEFDISSYLNNRHQDSNPSNTRRTVEDLLELKRYKELHDEFEEV